MEREHQVQPSSFISKWQVTAAVAPEGHSAMDKFQDEGDLTARLLIRMETGENNNQWHNSQLECSPLPARHL